MGLFLMLRQVVDTLHEFRVLDYLICAYAVFLIIYKSIKVKIYKNILSKVDLIDLIVGALCILYFCAYVRNRNGFSPFVKTESAFMVYFLGRLYGDELLKHINKIAIVSYIVVYMNLIMRTIEYVHYYTTKTLFSWERFGIGNGGGFFHYKTDLAIAVVIAVIFIYKSNTKKLMKYITIFPISSIIVFTCNARMGQVTLLVVYFIIFRDLCKKRDINIINYKKGMQFLFAMLYIFTFIIFVTIQYSSISKSNYLELFSYEEMVKLEKIFHSRHIIIWDNLHYFSKQNFFTRLTGIDLVSDSIHNATGDRAHCLYLKLILSVGYIGTLLFIEFLRKLFVNKYYNTSNLFRFLVGSLMIMFLFSGISMESIEYSQMSWFPFIFMGGLVTSAKTNEQAFVEEGK